MNFQLIASLFCFQTVVTRIAASKSLYSISCNLIALAHHFLAHIHYRCLCFFVFVLCLLGIVHVGILSGCLMMLWLSLLQGIRTLLVLGFRLFFFFLWVSLSLVVLWGHLFAVYQFINRLTLVHGHNTLSRFLLFEMVQVVLRISCEC